MSTDTVVGNPKKTCFVISPIGKVGTDIRRHSDELLEYILKPIVEEKFGYSIFRGDEIQEPGIINNQVLKSLLESDLVIADLTGKNGNVFYELAVRHITRKPFIQLIDEREDKPFDLAGTRIITFELSLAGAKKAMGELENYINSTLVKGFSAENPLSHILEQLGISAAPGAPTKQLTEQQKETVEDLTVGMKKQIHEYIVQLISEQGIGTRIMPDKDISLSRETKAKIEALNSINRNLENITGSVPSQDKIDISGMLTKANLFYYDKKYEQAVDLFDEILKKDPRHLDTLINKGWSVLGLGNEEEAKKISEKILEYYPDNLEALDIEATSFLNKGLNGKALEAYNKILARDNTYTHANALKGTCLVNLARYEEAIPVLETAINDYPNNFEYLERLGLSYEKTGKKDKSMKFYKKIVESISPNSYLDWNTKGNALFGMEKYNEAIEAYNEALKIAPSSLYTWFNKANSLGILERYEEAIEAYNEALKVNPTFLIALGNKGLTLEAIGKYEEAIEAYVEVLSIDPSNQTALERKKELNHIISTRKKKTKH